MFICKFMLLQNKWRSISVLFLQHNSLIASFFSSDFVKVKKATLRIQHAYRGWRQRLLFLRQRRAAIIIQSHLRGVFAREVAAALREIRRVEEEMRKREKLEEERRLREQEELERRRLSAAAEKERAELEEQER